MRKSVGCDADVMYIPEVVQDLEATLRALSVPGTEVFVAHGRNNRAEKDFLACCAAHGWSHEVVPFCELHAGYRAPDVTVLKLRHAHLPSF
jgi:hypothetical protein